MTATASARRQRAPQRRRHLRVVQPARSQRKIKKVRESVYRRQRLAKFEEALKYASAARAYRTALNVTQERVGRYYGVSGQAVGGWELGTYFGWTDEDLAHYTRVCDYCAGKGARPE